MSIEILAPAAEKNMKEIIRLCKCPGSRATASFKPSSAEQEKDKLQKEGAG
jgi:hypothetical protein